MTIVRQGSEDFGGAVARGLGSDGADLCFQICLLLTGRVTLGPIPLTTDSVRWNERQKERETQRQSWWGTNPGGCRGDLRELAGNQGCLFSCGPCPLPLVSQPEARAAASVCWLGKMCVSPPVL